MEYIIPFAEGIFTFISPCTLPLLPIYITYLAGGEKRDKKSTVLNITVFVLAFTMVFTILGAFAGTLGSFIEQYRTAVNIISGSVVVLLGINNIGLINFHFHHHHNSPKINPKRTGIVASFILGLVFSMSWTPCVATFITSTLILASQSGSTMVGVGMLLAYSLGLGIPYIISGIIIDKLSGTMKFMNENHAIIKKLSGAFLILMGLLMMTGFISEIHHFFE